MINVERLSDRVNPSMTETYYDPATGAVVFEKHAAIHDQSIHGRRGRDRKPRNFVSITGVYASDGL
jgi:hypothetical protein